MRKIKILDCTLRDGGFTNDWNFGQGTIKSIISRLDRARVDVIEIGLIDQRRGYDPNRSIVPDTHSFAPFLEGMNLQHAQISAMIDFGTCDLDRIEPRTETKIDIIRVIFKKKDIDEALAYCDAIKKKGYLVSVQPVSVTSYTKDDFLVLIEKINKISPYSVAIVDTYGLMHNVEVIEYFKLLEEHLLPTSCIGFHAHNNFQMAYANCISLLGVSTHRQLIFDGSLYGMGKGAGNAPTELLSQYFNENCDKQYDINQMLEAIDVDVMKEYVKSTWGYSLKYFIAASNDCHPDYVSTLMAKKSLSIKSINEILLQLPVSTKLTFDNVLLEKLYDEYQNQHIDDTQSYAELRKELAGRTIVLLAPGRTLETHKAQIAAYIEKHNAVVVSINFLHEGFPIDYVFMGNPKRYSQFFHKMYGAKSNVRVICTSNVTGTAFPIDYRLNFAGLKLDETPVRDNPMLMLLRALTQVGIGQVAVAGFDGYLPEAGANYYGQYIELLYCPDDVLMRNELIKTELTRLRGQIDFEYITPSLYM